MNDQTIPAARAIAHEILEEGATPNHPDMRVLAEAFQALDPQANPRTRLVNEATFVQLIRRATEVAIAHQELAAAQQRPGSQIAAGTPVPGRELALAITHLEDAQMRFTRGLAMLTERFAPADLELS